MYLPPYSFWLFTLILHLGEYIGDFSGDYSFASFILLYFVGLTPLTVWQFYEGFQFRQVKGKYSVSREANGRRSFGELIITNF